MEWEMLNALYKEYRTPKHVQKHMEKVDGVAGVLAASIRENGIKIDEDLVHWLSLVHDLMKAISFQTYDPKTFTRPPAKKDIKFWEEWREKYNGDDVAATSDILKKHGQRKLAKAILSQRFDAVISETHPLRSLEEKVVYYADKRVAHTKIVPLTTRLEEGWRRYGGGKVKSEHVKKIELAIYMLEEEIWTAKDFMSSEKYNR